MVSRALAKLPVRRFNLLEYQSKQLMRDFGVTVQKGGIASTPQGAFEVAKAHLAPYIVKANVPVGGRGLGSLTSGLKGGVQMCNEPSQVKEYSQQMLGYQLVTKQTTSEGVPVNSVLVFEAIEISKQTYLAFMLDRNFGGPVCIYSKHGGVSIEEIAVKEPGSVHILPISIQKGLTHEEATRVAKDLEFSEKEQELAVKDLLRLYELFIHNDAVQVEVNPWATTPDEKVYCVDAKINIDDNAIFRQTSMRHFIIEQEEFSYEDEVEKLAERQGLNYVGMNGNIGCMVNGAGLAMATMDIIKINGGEPANFLDVGGGASEDQMLKAFEILFSHPNLKSVFVNIYGGIVRCDLIAQNLMKAKQLIGFPCPVVARLQGNNADKATEIINQERSDELKVEPDFEAAAKLAIKIAN